MSRLTSACVLLSALTVLSCDQEGADEASALHVRTSYVPSVDLDDGLVHAVPFRFTQGFETPCEFGDPAYACDSPDEIGGIPDPGLGEQSISFWFRAQKPPAGEKTSALLAKGNYYSDHGGWRIFIGSTGILYFRAMNIKDGVRHKAAVRHRVSWKQWHHVVAIIDRWSSGGRLRLFLDGEEVGSSGGAGASTRNLVAGSSIHTPQKLRIAWARNPDNEARTHFWGRLDDLRIYDKVLPLRTIRALHDNPPEFRESLVYKRTSEYCYKIPAIIRRPNGELYAFAERRHTDKSNCPDTANADIVVRRSNNDGESWGPEWIIFDSRRAREEAGAEGAVGRNPTPVVDRDGHTWLYYMAAIGDDPSQNAVTDGETFHGQLLQRAHRRMLRFQDASPNDPELHISGPDEDITHIVKPADEDPEKRWMNFGPGHAISMHQGECAGRLIVPFFYNVGKRSPTVAAALIEDSAEDCGSTGPLELRLGQATAPISKAGKCDSANARDCQRSETQIAETASADSPTGSRLIMHSRWVREPPYTRRVAYSDDGGETWTTTTSAADLPSSDVHGSILGVEDTELSVVANAACEGRFSLHPQVRRNMTVRVSADGATPLVSRVIRRGSSGYGDLVGLEANWFGLLYEAPIGDAKGAELSHQDLSDADTGNRNDRNHPAYSNQGITFARFSMDWIEDDRFHEYEPCDVTGRASAATEK